MTYEVQQTRWDRLIRRVSGSIGPGSRVSETISELFPVLDVERVPGELLLLGGTRLGQGAASVTGAAGQRPRMQVFNPVDSGVLITVTGLWFSVQQTDTVRVATTNAVLSTGVATQTFRDRRLVITARPVGAIFTDSTVALTDANLLIRVLANVTQYLEDENGLAVLPPGSGYEIGSGTIASTLHASFLWRERPAEESELQF